MVVYIDIWQTMTEIREPFLILANCGENPSKAPKAYELLLRKIMVPNGWSFCELFTLDPDYPAIYIGSVAYSPTATQINPERK